MSRDKAAVASKARITKKAKQEKHRNLMNSGLKAEIKFNASMAEMVMQEQERKAKATNEAFTAKKMAEKLAARAKETEGDKQSLGDGLLMASGLDGLLAAPDAAAAAVVVEDEVEKSESTEKQSRKRKAADRSLAQSSRDGPMVSESDHSDAGVALEPLAKKSKKSKHAVDEPGKSANEKPKKNKKGHSSGEHTDVQVGQFEFSDASRRDHAEGRHVGAADTAKTDAAKAAEKAEKKKRKQDKRNEADTRPTSDAMTGSFEEPILDSKPKRKATKNLEAPSNLPVNSGADITTELNHESATDHKKTRKLKAHDSAHVQPLAHQVSDTTDGQLQSKPKADKKEKREKKERKHKRQDDIESRTDERSASSVNDGVEPKIKSNSSKKEHKRKNTDAESHPTTDGEAQNADAAEPNSDSKKSRFIVFLGNLPYTATASDISNHLSAISPSAVRLQHVKDTMKSKGFAFVEFAEYDRMNTCLKLYHHSTFDDGKSPARKINVELTGGGGGNGSEGRKEKLKEKNKRLDEERARESTKRKEGKMEKKEKKEVDGKDKDKDVQPAPSDPMLGVHPSRRARMG